MPLLSRVAPEAACRAGQDTVCRLPRVGDSSTVESMMAEPTAAERIKDLVDQMPQTPQGLRRLCESLVRLFAQAQDEARAAAEAAAEDSMVHCGWARRAERAEADL